MKKNIFLALICALSFGFASLSSSIVEAKPHKGHHKMHKKHKKGGKKHKKGGKHKKHRNHHRM